MQYFNPRSREGSDELHANPDRSVNNFNPRSREGSDRRAGYGEQEYGIISIHAPARGATSISRRLIQHINISIHAPARGATAVYNRSNHIQHDFNPRSREGSDYSDYMYCVAFGISIHAPARGATSSCLYCLDRNGWISIHAPARGATSCCFYLPFFQYQFQSTLPRGERLDRPHFVWFLHYNFNPRSREGSDTPIAGSRTFPLEISIHAPARGAT